MGLVRLDLNESPFKPPREVVEAALNALKEVNRYPPARLVEELRLAVAEYSGVRKDMVAIGCGADSLIALIIMMKAREGGPVAAPRYSFTMYREAAEASGLGLVWVPMEALGGWWRLDTGAAVEAARRASIVFIDRPNNPTGSMLVSIGELEEILEAAKGLVVVDEAYYEFSRETVAGLVELHDNLVVLRTFSKAFSLAGLRVGYAIASPGIASRLQSLLPFPTSTPSLAAALKALEEGSYVDEIVRYVDMEKGRVAAVASRLGARVYDSRANFLLIDTGVDGAAGRLEKLGVKVRRVPLGGSYVRVTVGSREENDKFLEALAKILEASRSSSS